MTIENAFPELNAQELGIIRRLGTVVTLSDGETAFRAGDADIDFYAVLEGSLEIVNPTDHGTRVAIHGPGQFAGDIDLLTRRPVVVTAIARGPTRLVRVPGGQFRRL
ncbi:MAG: cyclic nucleotide-binding domain-containing protein, partial [Phycisphaerales bacterium]|nr:cyclic nucleotide-binding domain-containing protein [Phycisphaerales bacterium]